MRKVDNSVSGAVCSKQLPISSASLFPSSLAAFFLKLRVDDLKRILVTSVPSRTLPEIGLRD